MSGFRAVGFDFNGVLARLDIHQQAAQVAYDKLAELKGDKRYLLTAEQHASAPQLGNELWSITRGLLALNAIVTADAPLDHPLIRETAKAKKAAYDELTKDGIPPLDGAIETVRYARQLLVQIEEGRLALVSTSYMNELAPFAATQGLEFDTIISKEDVGERVKPDPFAYALAAQRMGVEPTEMIAIEDTPGGLRAALEAGCFAIGFALGGNAEALHKAGASVIASSHEELRASLRELLTPA